MRICWLAVIFLACGIADGARAQACEEPGVRDQPQDPIAQGGRLYDKWWAVCGLPEPTGTHPAYPATGKQKGSATWRCKECHGWDYRGSEGAYGKGSHYSGIAGIARQAGGDEAAIAAVLRDATHRFDTVLPSVALERLARFVSRGQVDAGPRIDAATKKAQGRPAHGKRQFERRCAVCHGAQGRALNFAGQAGEVEYLGTIAADNPWELLHKIRNGQPGSVMDQDHLRAAAADPDGGVGMMGRGHMHRHMLEGRAMPPMREQLSLEQQLDLIAYLQTLPVR